MPKISILDTSIQRRLVILGKLIASWAALLRSVWRKATADLNGRELVIDVEGLTAITEDGENILLELMQEGASFRSSGCVHEGGPETALPDDSRKYSGGEDITGDISI